MFTHFNEAGRAHMVEVTDKEDTLRVAVAYGTIRMAKETLLQVKEMRMKKGDVLAVAQVAGVMAAKKTWDLIPMCHPLMLTGVNLEFLFEEDKICIRGTVKTFGKTGVEMEALTAVSTAALTIYDMCKAVDKNMEISAIYLGEKTGGKSGDYRKVDGNGKNSW